MMIRRDMTLGKNMTLGGVMIGNPFGISMIVIPNIHPLLVIG